MPLTDVKFAREVVEYGGTTFSLGPLSLSDLATLIRGHAPTLERVFAVATPDLEGDDHYVKQVAAHLATIECGDIIGDAIALSAREPYSEDVARQLPALIQARAIIAILNLTLAGFNPTIALLGLGDSMRELRAKFRSVAELSEGASV